MQKCMRFCYRVSMVAIQIRDVSPELRDALTAEARRREQSLQAFLHEVLEREGRAAHNRAVLDRARDRARQRATSVTMEEILAAIDEGRGSSVS
jgi:DNA-binding phage protein